MTRYILDENLYHKIGHNPKNQFNVSEVYRIHHGTISPKKIPDMVVLQLAIDFNYVIITRDRGLTLASLMRGKDVIYCGLNGIFHLKASGVKRVKCLEELK